eukprot:gene27898-36752_t
MISFVLLIAAFAAASAFTPSRFAMRQRSSLSMANIVEVAVGAGNFNTLVAAVKAAGLVETLSTGGPFTVFAPTDAAFAKLPAGTVDALLKDIPKLTAILTYHVVPGKVRPTRNGKTYDTVNGKEISSKVTVDTTDTLIYGGHERPSKIIKWDIQADNGLIHAVDEVFIPYEGTEAPLHN